MTETHGVFVRVRAGIDVIMREAIWEFHTIDPTTGIYWCQKILSSVLIWNVFLLYYYMISFTRQEHIMYGNDGKRAEEGRSAKHPRT